MNVPHQLPVSVWECDSIVEAFLDRVHTCEFTSIEQAEEFFNVVPEKLRKMLEYEEKVIGISECNGHLQDFIPADEFENPEILEWYAEWYFRKELNNMFVLKNEKDGWDLIEYKGHKELEVQKAAREIIEKMRIL